MRSKLKQYKVLAMEELAEEIAESEIIDAEKFEELRDSTEYISCEEEKSLKRFNLAAVYRYPIEKMTGKWVFKYNEPDIISAFINLRHISLGSNPNEAIANMSKYDISDYHNEIRSNKHKLVCLLIRKLGFKFKILEDSSIIIGNFIKNINTLMIMRGYKKIFITFLERPITRRDNSRIVFEKINNVLRFYLLFIYRNGDQVTLSNTMIREYFVGEDAPSFISDIIYDYSSEYEEIS